MKMYNGYTASERSRAGNIQRKKLANGELVNPDRCEYLAFQQKNQV